MARRKFAMPCLRCGALTKNGSYCRAHTKKSNPEYADATYRKNRKIVIDQWLKDQGPICPGLPGVVAPHALREGEHLTTDHLLPLSRGGTNDVENLMPRCRSCNSKRGSMLRAGGM